MVKFAAVLKKSYTGARKKNGELYTKASLVGIHFRLQRFVSCQKMDIIKDPTSPKPTLHFKRNFTPKREGKAQTQTQASKPLKCGTSAIFDLNLKKRV